MAKRRRNTESLSTVPDVRLERGEAVWDKLPVIDERTGRKVGETAVVRVQSRLERMAKRGEITPIHRRAGERFALEMEQASRSTRSCLDFDTTAGGGDIAPSRLGAAIAEAELAVRAAMQCMGLTVWPVVVWVAVDGRSAKEWAVSQGMKGRDGLPVLRIGLEALRLHYALDDE
jgi:hypothetical protein